MIESIKIALADDHTSVRESMCSYFGRSTYYEVIIEASNGVQLLNLMSSQLPDIVLLDVEMPVMQGKETLIQIVQKFPSTKVIMFSMHDDVSTIAEYIELGARAFVKKNCSLKELTDIICQVNLKGKFIQPDVQKYLNSSSNCKVLKKTKPTLSSRELQVLEHLKENKTNREIAHYLNIGIRTVEFHRQSLLQKTGSTNFAAILWYAIKKKSNHIKKEN